MQSSWLQSYHMVREEEGGNDDDPVDPGGRTSRGIVQREYNAYRQVHNLPTQDVFKASEAEIEDIYHHQYWDPWCDRLPAGVDCQYFDMCVLQGPQRATLTLQKALRNAGQSQVIVDGRMGLVTLGAANAINDRKSLIEGISKQRLAFFHNLRTWWHFGRGWTARTALNQKTALEILNGPQPVAA